MNYFRKFSSPIHDITKLFSSFEYSFEWIADNCYEKMKVINDD